MLAILQVRLMDFWIVGLMARAKAPVGVKNRLL
jgi:hypothetical protein